jgi:hypothetical protein
LNEENRLPDYKNLNIGLIPGFLLSTVNERKINEESIIFQADSLASTERQRGWK